jgi:hypothetical protein
MDINKCMYLCTSCTMGRLQVSKHDFYDYQDKEGITNNLSRSTSRKEHTKGIG